MLIKKEVLYAEKIRAGRNGPLEWKSPGGIFRGRTQAARDNAARPAKAAVKESGHDR